MLILKIDTRRIVDEASLHDVLHETFVLPAKHAKNWDALIDTLTQLDQPETKSSGLSLSPGHQVVVVLNYAEGFATKRPSQYQQLTDAIAFVNWRRIEKNQPPVITLAYHRQ